MSDCCLRGFRWEAQPCGTESTIANIKTYITGNNSSAAVVLIADLFGWTFPNIRLLADHYADEADATVYVPDFFGGEVLPPQILAQRDQKDWDKLDLERFLERNAKHIREPEMIAVCRALKSQYKRVGAVGFCYGGWAAFSLGSKTNQGLVECISTGHPTFLEKEEMNNVGVPVQILAPEYDEQFTEELKLLATSTIPKLGVPFDYQYFPGIEHAFATRGDPNDEAEREGMERAKDCVVLWLRQWLHERKR